MTDNEIKKVDHLDALYGVNSAMRRVITCCEVGNVEDAVMFCELHGLACAMEVIIGEMQ